jgi:hypothetical protein
VGRGDFVNTTMKLHIPQEAATFLMSWATISFWS